MKRRRRRTALQVETMECGNAFKPGATATKRPGSRTREKHSAYHTVTNLQIRSGITVGPNTTR